MHRLIIGLLSAAGGLIIGGVSGRKTSNITMKDVKAVPGKAGSAILGAVKKTGRKIGSGFSSLAFWKKKEMKKETVNLEKDHMDLVVKHQGLSEKYAKLSDDFSETVKRMDLMKVERDDYEEQTRQEKEKNVAFQNTVDDQDADLKKAAVEKKQLSSDLKTVQTALAKLEKSTPEN